MVMRTFRCSELDRVLACNGSMTLVPLVDKRTGSEGDEGTALHWLAHARMQKELSAGGNLGPQPPMPKSVAFSSWVGDFYFKHVQETAPADWSLECEVPLAYEFQGFALSGHIDCLALNADATEAIGFDLKTGYDPVDAADCNWQILGYMVLLLMAYPDLKKITFWIVQPRNDEDEGFERCSSITMEGARLSAAGITLQNALNIAIANNMEVSTSPKACKWCSAAIACPAAIELRELMKATLTPELLATIKATPDDAALGEWVMAGQSLDRPMEDAKKLLKERIKANGSATAADGTVITIKTQGGSYSFPDPVAFYRETRKLIQNDDVYAATVKPSVSKTIDALADVLGIPKTSKAGPSAKSTFDGALRPLCEQGTKEILVFS